MMLVPPSKFHHLEKNGTYLRKLVSFKMATLTFENVTRASGTRGTPLGLQLEILGLRTGRMQVVLVLQTSQWGTFFWGEHENQKNIPHWNDH